MRVEIPYPESVPDLFEKFSDLPWPVLLDSAGLGRYDILCASPFITLVTRRGLTEITDRNGETISLENPFDLVRKRLLPLGGEADLPFMGGAIGFFGYDLGLALHGIASQKADSGIPDLAVGIYDWAIVVDHEKKIAHLASHCRDPHTLDLWDEIQDRLKTGKKAAHGASWISGNIQISPSYEKYALAFDKIKNYIASGDCYQVNLAQQFEAPLFGNPWTLYRDLRKASPAPFSAYLSNQHGQMLSSSPERFLQVSGGLVETRPIKGTRPRSPDPFEDERLAKALLESAKDRAENLMIVDLLRNDLGKVCETGTVKVEKLFEVEHYATVHHLVSTVKGRIKANDDAISVLEQAFPGGSVTGAPKIRAMEIIEELEPFRRGPYCGSVAYIGFDGKMDSSIAIRTLFASEGRIRFWAGGGIVSDSDRDSEYQEIRDKAKAMLGLVESP